MNIKIHNIVRRRFEPPPSIDTVRPLYDPPPPSTPLPPLFPDVWKTA